MYLCTGNNTTPIIMPSPERQDYESPFFDQRARRKVGVQLARKKLASIRSIPYLCPRISITDQNRLPMYMQTSTYQQEDYYYPYGGLMGESSGGEIQPYKYNGKELDRMHGWTGMTTEPVTTMQPLFSGLRWTRCVRNTTQSALMCIVGIIR